MPKNRSPKNYGSLALVAVYENQKLEAGINPRHPIYSESEVESNFYHQDKEREKFEEKDFRWIIRRFNSKSRKKQEKEQKKLLEVFAGCY